MVRIIEATGIKVGYQLAESDGFLWNVNDIVKETPETITVRLCSDFSSFKDHWTIKPNGSRGEIIKTFRKSTKLYAVVGNKQVQFLLAANKNF